MSSVNCENCSSMFTADPDSTAFSSLATNLSEHLQKTRSTIVARYFLWSEGTTARRRTCSIATKSAKQNSQPSPTSSECHGFTYHRHIHITQSTTSPTNSECTAVHIIPESKASSTKEVKVYPQVPQCWGEKAMRMMKPHMSDNERCKDCHIQNSPTRTKMLQ